MPRTLFRLLGSKLVPLFWCRSLQSQVEHGKEVFILMLFAQNNEVTKYAVLIYLLKTYGRQWARIIGMVLVMFIRILA